MFQRSMQTAEPMVKKSRSPTILQPMLQARNTPVATNQVHHCDVNSLHGCQQIIATMWLLAKLTDSGAFETERMNRLHTLGTATLVHLAGSGVFG